MIIYGEYLFLENFITGILIVFFTGKIAGESLRFLRTGLCGILCGAYSFSMLLAIRPVAGILGKILFLLLISRIGFGKKGLKRLFLNGVLFFAVTLLYGGTVIGMLHIFGWQGITASEGIYLPAATYITVTAAGAAGSLFLWFITELIRERRGEMRTKVAVTLHLGNQRWDLEGFVDSGNFLRDPFSGKPVAIVRRSMMEQILKNYGDRPVRYMAIPYSSVGTAKGILDGYRIDALTVGEQIVQKPVLAVCRDEEFFAERNDKGQILLPESMLERGIYADLESDQNFFSKAVWRKITAGFRKEHLLYRGQRCASSASGPGRGTGNAGEICGRKPGGKSSSD